MLNNFLQLDERLILIDNYLYPKVLKVYSSKHIDIIPMNSTGILILSLCDGVHTGKEIVECVSEYYEINKTEIQKDIERFIKKQIKHHNIKEFTYAKK